MNSDFRQTNSNISILESSLKKENDFSIYGDSNILINMRDIASDTKIYRIISLKDLINILKGKLRLTRRDSFSDCHERGQYITEEIKCSQKETLDRRRSNLVRIKRERLEVSMHLYASCWTLEDKEIFPMWRAYAADKFSVRIQTTVEHLLTSLSLNSSQRIFCSKMRYSEEIDRIKAFDILFHKTEEYEVENEFRLYLSTDCCSDIFYLPLVLGTFIDGITFSPFIEPDLANFMASYLVSINPTLRFKFSTSNIIEY